MWNKFDIISLKKKSGLKRALINSHNTEVKSDVGKYAM